MIYKFKLIRNFRTAIRYEQALFGLDKILKQSSTELIKEVKQYLQKAFVTGNYPDFDEI